MGSYADGRSRIERHHWKNCRPAYVRPGQQLGQRPKLGRPSLPTPQTVLTSPDPELSTNDDSLTDFSRTENQNNSTGDPPNSNESDQAQIINDAEPVIVELPDSPSGPPNTPPFTRTSSRSTRGVPPAKFQDYFVFSNTPWSATDSEIQELNRAIGN